MPTGQHVEVNGLRMFYEEEGAGRPVVLLHGGGPAVGAFASIAASLTRTRRVVSPHLQGHGHTKDVDRAFRYEAMADDVAPLMTALGIEKADLVGYSLGGGVALQTAIRHPARVERLVLAAATMKREGFYPEVLAAFERMEEEAPKIGERLRQSPFGASYPEVDWTALFRKLGDMNVRRSDWSSEVKALQSSTMLIYADADCVRPEHIIEFWKALGGGQRDAGVDGSLRPASRLAIIPNATHYNLLQAQGVAEAIASFLADD